MPMMKRIKERWNNILFKFESKEAEIEQGDSAHFKDLDQDLTLGYFLGQPTGDAQGNAEAHDPEETGENKVGHCRAIPFRVTNPPVGPTAAVYEDHQDDAYSRGGK